MDIRPIGPGDLEKASQILARAFQHDPVTNYMFPDDNRRPDILQWAYFRWTRLLASLGGAFTIGDVDGVALWIPPEHGPEISILKQIRSGLLWAPFKIGIAGIWGPMKAYADVGRRHREEIKEPHWILDVLGVSPNCQGKGLGGALLHHQFAIADRDRIACYVITHNLKNIPFYEHHGFQLIKTEYALADGPPTCSLRRPVPGS